jgi:outer membrane PBP1 activator LpoA protein
MKQAPYVRHFGQTGILQLNENNILTRSLIWGQYQPSGVNQVSLNE